MHMATATSAKCFIINQYAIYGTNDSSQQQQQQQQQFNPLTRGYLGIVQRQRRLYLIIIIIMHLFQLRLPNLFMQVMHHLRCFFSHNATTTTCTLLIVVVVVPFL